MKIILKNLRLSYPCLFEKRSFEGSPGKYDAVFLLSKEDHNQCSILSNLVKELKTENNLTVKSDRICIKDGDTPDFEPYDGYANHMVIRASSKRTVLKYDKDGNALICDDGTFYAGCYVDAVMKFWFLQHLKGNRICADLYGVRFAKEGDPLGNAPAIDNDEIAFMLGVKNNKSQANTPFSDL